MFEQRHEHASRRAEDLAQFAGRGRSGGAQGTQDDRLHTPEARFEQDEVGSEFESLAGVEQPGLSADARRSGGHRITEEQANAVFLRSDLPRYVCLTATTFQGFERLPLDGRGALGEPRPQTRRGMDGDNRREMRTIRDEVGKHNSQLAVIANKFRSMKRLWVGKNEDGLLGRRDAEAALVENAKD